MKTKIFYFVALCFTLMLASCDKTETFNDQWKNGNEEAFELTKANPTYSTIESQSKAGSIAYKVINKGTGEVSPIFTDKVKVNYTGYYKKDWTKGDTYTDSEGNLVKNIRVFETTESIPVELTINEYNFDRNSVVTDGFATALQHMKVGDKWEVWIPWKMGYKDRVQGNIPAYTTLVFEIELLEIVK